MRSLLYRIAILPAHPRPRDEGPPNAARPGASANLAVSGSTRALGPDSERGGGSATSQRWPLTAAIHDPERGRGRLPGRRAAQEEGVAQRRGGQRLGEVAGRAGRAAGDVDQGT